MKRVSPRRAWLPPRLRGERGAVAPALLILPIAIVSVMLAIHFSLVLHGRNVAAAAAQDGLRAAQLDGATEGNGHAAASRTLALFPSIQSTEIEISRGEDMVTITVTGEVSTPLASVFKFNDFKVSLEGPVERFYAESERE